MGIKINEIVEKINKILEAGEPENIQEIQASGGRILHGYKPQFLIDALNEVYPNWKIEWKIIETVEQKNSILAIAEVSIEIEGLTRKQVGQSTNMNKGDAIKGAITDGIAKALSLFSIGNRAFRGELGKQKTYKNKSKTTTKTEPPANSKTISEKQAKRLFAIAKEKGWSLEDLKEMLTLLGLKHSTDIPKSVYDRVIDFIEEHKSAHEGLKDVLKLRADIEGYKGNQLVAFLGDIAEEDILLALQTPDVWEQVIEDYKEMMKQNNEEFDF